jgi:hypothetical protein
MNLINDILLKTGVITSFAQSGGDGIPWFKNITIFDILATYLLPLIFFLGLAVYLKLRYNKRKQREDITLRAFLRD